MYLEEEEKIIVKSNYSNHLIIKNIWNDSPSRHDYSRSFYPLQISKIVDNKQKIFRPHYHITTTEKKSYGTQEVWYIYSGRVLADLYDTLGNRIMSFILEPGDMCITFEGGHKYTILEDNTKVIEFKSGPYLGVEKDKIIIEEK